MQVPAIIDLEASGFGAGSYPIEVGYVLPDGSSDCTLIRPVERWTHWDASAEAVHGIARQSLFDHGRAPGEVAAMLNRSLRGLVVYSDGWSHDYTWLAVLFDEAGMVPNFKLEHLAALVGHFSAREWAEARNCVEEDFKLRRHRASNDARVLQLTWARLQKLRHAA